MKILIVGLGVIGASFAEGLKQKGHYIYGVDKDESTLSYALNKHIIDEGSTDIKDFMHVAKLIILCIYPRAILDILKENNFTEEQIITDVSGVKEILLTEIEKLPLKASYVSIHPMAGREKKGIMYADKSRFINANYLIIPTKFSTDEAINVMKEVACDLEFGEITIMDKKYHDHMIAKTSQLPHALAVALVLADEEVDTVKYIGDSYRDLTRIAMINHELWIELFLENKDNLLKNIAIFEKKLDNIKDCLKNDKFAELALMFKQSTKKRELMNKEKVAK